MYAPSSILYSLAAFSYENGNMEAFRNEMQVDNTINAHEEDNLSNESNNSQVVSNRNSVQSNATQRVAFQST